MDGAVAQGAVHALHGSHRAGQAAAAASEVLLCCCGVSGCPCASRPVHAAVRMVTTPTRPQRCTIRRRNQRLGPQFATQAAADVALDNISDHLWPSVWPASIAVSLGTISGNSDEALLLITKIMLLITNYVVLIAESVVLITQFILLIAESVVLIVRPHVLAVYRADAELVSWRCRQPSGALLGLT